MMHLRSAALLVLVLALPWALHAQAISMNGSSDDIPRLEFGANYNYFHANAPPEDGRGVRRVMQLALKDAGLEPRAVQYLNAHATSTPLGDRAEARAIRDASPLFSSSWASTARSAAPPKPATPSRSASSIMPQRAIL